MGNAILIGIIPGDDPEEARRILVELLLIQQKQRARLEAAQNRN